MKAEPQCGLWLLRHPVTIKDIPRRHVQTHPMCISGTYPSSFTYLIDTWNPLQQLRKDKKKGHAQPHAPWDGHISNRFKRDAAIALPFISTTRTSSIHILIQLLLALPSVMSSRREFILQGFVQSPTSGSLARPPSTSVPGPTRPTMDTTRRQFRTLERTPNIRSPVTTVRSHGDDELEVLKGVSTQHLSDPRFQS